MVWGRRGRRRRWRRTGRLFAAYGLDHQHRLSAGLGMVHGDHLADGIVFGHRDRASDGLADSNRALLGLGNRVGRGHGFCAVLDHSDRAILNTGLIACHIAGLVDRLRDGYLAGLCHGLELGYRPGRNNLVGHRMAGAADHRIGSVFGLSAGQGGSVGLGGGHGADGGHGAGLRLRGGVVAGGGLRGGLGSKDLVADGGGGCEGCGLGCGQIGRVGADDGGSGGSAGEDRVDGGKHRRRGAARGRLLVDNNRGGVVVFLGRVVCFLGLVVVVAGWR